MRKIITFVGLVGVGVFAGWNSHALYSSFTKKADDISKSSIESLPVTEVFRDSTANVSSPQFFSSNNLLNNTQLGMVIELIKQDLDIESQNQLNKDVVQYAKSLLKNSIDTENSEQRLIALLGNYDTKEEVLDILARFYEKQEKYELAITSLFNLRSMSRFDEDYKKITSRINVLSRKNLKKLESYNYKSEMVDFFEFLITKEPDNFSVQMQYAEFEYKNRNFSHAEQLLSILAYHPDYANQSEALLQKSRHQQDLIENGIVPVPVEKKGDHYVVSAVINNQEPVKLIIDTGATLTILSPKVIHDLGLRVEDVQQYMAFSTANGTVQAPVMLLDSISIRNHQVKNIQVGVLSTFSETQYEGLLGMNFLSQFVFFIDQKNSTLELVDIE